MSSSVGASVDDVIIVGAGPTGLMLGRELALAGVRCRVLERRANPTSESRALGLQARTLDVFDMRGIADEIIAEGNPLSSVRLSLGNSLLDLSQLDTRFGHLHILPQSKTETILEHHATPPGVSVERDTEVLGVVQHDDHVVLRVRRADREWDERARWVVGCDGAHSVVRTSQNIDFVGRTYPYTIIVADVRLVHEPAEPLMIRVGPHGIVVSTDFGNGWFRMGVIDRTKQWSDDPVTIEEVRTTLEALYGRDLGPSDPLWTSRFRIQERQAATYRKGRVLLSGDAAHVHSPLGGQGLNLGLQDAMNLGWKLAAVARGQAGDGLLDTYVTERRRVSNAVIRATDIATRVMTSGQIPPRVFRNIVVPVALRVRRSHQLLAGGLSGISVRYRHTGPRPEASGKGAAIIGSRLPDFEIRQADGGTQSLFRLLRAGHFVLVHRDSGQLAEAALPWKDRLVTVAGQALRPQWRDWAGILSRPDGYCAWVGGPDDAQALRSALHYWGGTPT